MTRQTIEFLCFLNASNLFQENYSKPPIFFPSFWLNVSSSCNSCINEFRKLFFFSAVLIVPKLGVSIIHDLSRLDLLSSRLFRLQPDRAFPEPTVVLTSQSVALTGDSLVNTFALTCHRGVSPERSPSIALSTSTSNLSLMVNFPCWNTSDNFHTLPLRPKP